MASQEYSLVIRGGAVYDGAGGPPLEADVAIRDGKIVAVGAVAGSGAEEIDARGRIVTPGFVDIHTHYDGQATWEHHMWPSSNHGVTTVVAGNCGVGFAPCRAGDRETLIAVMEGVEDIPDVVMAVGVPWNWETFPEYMTALEARRLDLDIAVQFPHSPLRVYVMGQRGADREPSTSADRLEMRRLTAEAIRAGALGVSTSRSFSHRRKDGELAPSVDSEVEELLALAGGLRDAGAGVFQIIPDLKSGNVLEEFGIIRRIAEVSGRPVSFSLAVMHDDAATARTMLEQIELARRDGLRITAQVYPRPIGVLFGLDLSYHPFALKPSFRPLEGLSLEDKVREMRDPQLRARLIAEEQDDPNPVAMQLCSDWDDFYVLGDPPDYSPPRDVKLTVIAERRGVSVAEAAYDLLLDNEGRTILYRPATNFVDGKLDAARELVAHSGTVLGLGDGGAHYGLICDAAFPTYMLTRWTRDAAPDEAFDLSWTIKALTSEPAATVGLTDRGRIAPGLRADLNVIDYDALALESPRVKRDLPAGGKRLSQEARGYVASIVAGEVTFRDGAPTGALPGRLIRAGAFAAS